MSSIFRDNKITLSNAEGRTFILETDKEDSNCLKFTIFSCFEESSIVRFMDKKETEMLIKALQDFNSF